MKDFKSTQISNTQLKDLKGGNTTYGGGAGGYVHDFTIWPT
ncbi:MAG: hypothetical protein AB8B69_22330 [Chitinophagales bacterium]